MTEHRTLRQCFEQHTGRLIDKWSHYFPIYERHFAKFVGRAISLLEIGVGHGGSLQLWKAYFGPKAQILGLDIDVRCRQYEEPQISVTIQPQQSITWGPPAFDIVIDDGSHLPEDQASSFKQLWSCIRPGGVYLIEDCGTHYPSLSHNNALIYTYPWVMVCEKPKRMVTGKPSRPLTQAELEAYGARYALEAKAG